MDADPVTEMLGRPLRLAVIGGGPGSFIGAMHRTAARLDGRYDSFIDAHAPWPPSIMTEAW